MELDSHASRWPHVCLVDAVCAQALSLGLGERWEKVKDAYAHANRALGDIVKVTPSSKVRQMLCNSHCKGAKAFLMHTN